MFRILVVEDDETIVQIVKRHLQSWGYEVFQVEDFAHVIQEFVQKDPQLVLLAYSAMYDNVHDLIISDIMMPGEDGFEFAKNIRKLSTNIPILFMTARDDIASKQLGYNLGIDDYMVKPVNLDELIMRINALLRRAKIAESKRITIGKLSINADERSVLYDGEEINLTSREFNIIYKMLSYPKKTFSRTQLMDEFWGTDTTSGTRTVDVYMTKLRDKFSKCKEFEIVTVHGLGYKVVINESQK